MNNYIEKILKKIEKANNSKRIKIRCRKKTKYFSIYLDLWKDNKRHYIYLKHYLKGTKDSFHSDNEILRYAIAYRDKKELELLLKDTGFEIKGDKVKADFVAYFKSLAEKKKGSTRRKWLSLYRHLYSFCNGKTAIKSIDMKFCISFYEYLKTFCSYSTPKVYYKLLTAALNKLVLDGVISLNPAKKAKQDIDFCRQLQKDKERSREFLTIEEIKKLINIPLEDIQTKNAFLFSCFTGLRLSDIKKLTFDKISEDYLNFRQSKTEEDERMKLHPIAKKIIEEQRISQNSRSEKVFSLYENKALNRHLKKWLINAGINKKITFHSGRHSFATMCLTKDIDIYTVSKLLGHKDLESTQIYAKLIDKKKDEAIDKLADI